MTTNCANDVDSLCAIAFCRPETNEQISMQKFGNKKKFHLRSPANS